MTSLTVMLAVVGIVFAILAALYVWILAQLVFLVCQLIVETFRPRRAKLVPTQREPLRPQDVLLRPF